MYSNYFRLQLNHFPSDLVNIPFARFERMVRPTFACFESPSLRHLRPSIICSIRTM